MNAKKKDGKKMGAVSQFDFSMLIPELSIRFMSKNEILDVMGLLHNENLTPKDRDRKYKCLLDCLSNNFPLVETETKKTKDRRYKIMTAADYEKYEAERRAKRLHELNMEYCL